MKESPAFRYGETVNWKHFFPDRAQPEILKHVRRRDIGADGYYKADENCRDSKAITAAMSYFRAKGKNRSIELCHKWLEDDRELAELQEFGETILAEEEAIVYQIAATAIESELCGYICGKVKTAKEHDRLASQIGNAIARNNPQWHFAWIVSSDGVGNSLRSFSADGEPFDVSAIAQQMGGGGHREAAGFKDSIALP